MGGAGSAVWLHEGSCRPAGAGMIFRSAISTKSDTTTAVDQVCRVAAGLRADLAVVFASHHHGPAFDDLLAGIIGRIDARNLIGCTGESIIGPDREIEQSPAVVLWVAKMPGVKILPFCVDQDDLVQFDRPEDWYDRLGVGPKDRPSFIVLPEPFSIHVDRCLEAMDSVFSSSLIVGGVASGANGPGQNRLFLGDQVLRQGMVGVSLCGPMRVSTVVSPGCRPIGSLYVVTRAKENVITELGGQPVLEVLQEIFSATNDVDRALIQKGLMLGRAVDGRRETFRPGDFLIRNVMGIVEKKGIAINEMIRAGQTVQFHVRDSHTASAEMASLLATRVDELGGSPAGGLLFSCNGRGRRMFGSPNHDIGLVNRLAERCTAAGFFAGGEIGPVGGQTFVHGFTTSLILFSEADTSTNASGSPS